MRWLAFTVIFSIAVFSHSSCNLTNKDASLSGEGRINDNSLAPTPDELYGELFEQVQMQQIFCRWQILCGLHPPAPR